MRQQEPVKQGVGTVEQVAPRTDLVFTVPNLISFLRLLMVPVFAYLIITGMDGWALLVLAASGVSDFLDGYLARTWHQESELGRKLDPAADRLYILSTLVGLAWRDLMLLGTLPALRRLGLASLPVHYLGKAATFNLLYAFPLILLGQGDSTLADIARPLGWAFAWWGTGLYWWAGVLYLRQLRDLVRADRILAAGRPPDEATS